MRFFRYLLLIILAVTYIHGLLFGQTNNVNTRIREQGNDSKLLVQNGKPILYPAQHFIHDFKREQTPWTNINYNKSSQKVLSDSVFFQPVAGPPGGTVRSITLDSGGWLFIATDGEVYRSKDNGLHWDINLFPSQAHNVVEPVMILGPNVVVAETDVNNFISRDRGDSWNYLTDDVQGFAVDTTGEIYAGSKYGGVKKSTDTAITWTQFSLAGQKIWKVVLCGAGKFACPADSGIFYSADYGITWIFRYYDAKHTYNLVSDKRGQLYCIKYFGDSYQLYRSKDFGESWQHIMLPLSDDVYRIYLENDGSVLIVTYDRILISADSGETWREVGFPMDAPLTVGRDAAGNLLAGNFYGIHKLNNTNGEWQELNTGIHALRIETIQLTSSGSILVLSLGTCFRSTDDGENWTRVNIGNEAVINYFAPILSASDGSIFIAASSINHSECGLLRSADDGVTWEEISVLANHYIITGIADGSSSDILVSTYIGHIYRSTDSGYSWSRVFSSAAESEITCLATDKAGNYYAAKDSTILYSHDGVTWQVFSLKRGYSSEESISIDTRKDVFLARSSHGVYHSSNLGRTWNELNDGLFDQNIGSITADDSGNVVLGTSSGIFRLADSDDYWQWFSNGLPDNYTISLSISAEGFLYAGTQNFGMYRSASPIGKRIQTRSSSEIGGFSLYQNYPNPFNAETFISYELYSPARIEIVVYNVLGQTVTSLVSGDLSEGRYVKAWLPERLSSGLFFCRMKVFSGSTTHSKTIKLVYLR